MEVRLENLRPIDVVSRMRVGPYRTEAPLAWQEIWSWLRVNGLADTAKLAVGFGLDSPRVIPEQMLRYVACVELTEQSSGDASAGVEQRRIEGGRFAIYRMQGAYSKMADEFMRLHDDWLPNSGKTPDYTRPFLEIYVNDPTQVEEADLLTDLCLPIREDR